VIIFLGRPHPKKLLTFFLAGALLVSVSIGLAAVNVLNAADIGSSSRRSFGAGLYLGLGAVAMVVGLHFLRTRPKPKSERPKKGPSMTDRVLTRDSSWLVFALGIVLNLPGIWYLMGLKDIALGGYSEVEEVLLILGFNIIMFSFVEIPLVGYLVAPEWSKKQIDRFNSWLHAHARHIGGYIGVGVGAFLIARGIYVLV
jgi:hypothetical protein